MLRMTSRVASLSITEVVAKSTSVLLPTTFALSPLSTTTTSSDFPASGKENRSRSFGRKEIASADSLTAVAAKPKVVKTLKVKHMSDYRKDAGLDTDDGVFGDKQWEWHLAQDDRSVFPTLETFDTVVNGIKFRDLPICHIRASKNNTIVTFTDSKGLILASTSASREGFKHAKKKSTVAGQTTGLAAGLRALRRDIHTVRVVVKGLGPGRFSAINGLTLAGVTVASITDFTRLPETGRRPKKKRWI